MESKTYTYRMIESALKTLGLSSSSRTKSICKDWNRRSLLYKYYNDEEGQHY